MLRKKKGVALPGAIALASFLLIVSLAVSSIIIELITLNQIKTIVNENNMHFSEIYSEFRSKDSGEDRITKINNYVYSLNHMDDAKYRYFTFVDNPDDEHYRSLVVYKLREDTILYYAIYDVKDENHKTIAYQTDSTKIYKVLKHVSEQEGDRYYLGGIIKLDQYIPPVEAL